MGDGAEDGALPQTVVHRLEGEDVAGVVLAGDGAPSHGVIDHLVQKGPGRQHHRPNALAFIDVFPVEGVCAAALHASHVLKCFLNVFLGVAGGLALVEHVLTDAIGGHDAPGAHAGHGDVYLSAVALGDEVSVEVPVVVVGDHEDEVAPGAGLFEDLLGLLDERNLAPAWMTL